MPSKPGEEPAGKELIASRTFCSLTIKEKSPGLKASGKKSSRNGEGCFFFILQQHLHSMKLMSHPRTIIYIHLLILFHPRYRAFFNLTLENLSLLKKLGLTILGIK
jgi:hypothetical protein